MIVLKSLIISIYECYLSTKEKKKKENAWFSQKNENKNRQKDY